MKRRVGKTVIELVEGDITNEETEAIVNAANSSLLGGGGVDGAIHRAGGPDILKECRLLGGCRPGEAKTTGGGNLKARYVIHTVGPIYRSGQSGEGVILKNAYINSLKAASENNIKSIAFPSISTGAYGYPLELASLVAISAVASFVKNNSSIDLVKFVLFSHRDYEAYKKSLEQFQ